MSDNTLIATLMLVPLLTISALSIIDTMVGNRWDCAAEDEVVVIDDTCRHIDSLHGVE